MAIPWRGDYREILNQLEDENHHKGVIYFNESTPEECKVIGTKYEHWGIQFISHSQLHFSPSLNCQYLKDNTLYFRVSAKVTSKTKPWLVT